jgi:type II secretory pathway pseudopilin PulG
VELLVVISIISMLMAILVPAVNGVRRQARALVGMHNQKEVAYAVNLFAMDNGDKYPPSVATVGVGDTWNWTDPRQMTGDKWRSPQVHRSMSAYLQIYIPDADTLFSPTAPRKYTHLDAMWAAGDDWDNPDTLVASDPASGSYCFWWNYIGYLGEGPKLFRGPRTPAAMGRQSKLLMSDYLGYGHWRSPGQFSSSVKLRGAEVVSETWLLSSCWSAPGDPNEAMPEIKLQAAYTDGHVETWSGSGAVPMRVSKGAEGVPPYEDDDTLGKGIFFLPENAVR